MILTIRTDKPEAEISVYSDAKQVAYETWPAHRELARTLHKKIEMILDDQGKTIHDIKGIVCFQGPGSFTGLRIGLTVGNTLAYSLGVPVVGAINEDWIRRGLERLQSGENDAVVLPTYGRDAHITIQKK